MKTKLEFIETALRVLTTEELKAGIIALMDNHEKGADIVLSCALNVLETRIESDEFVAFCDSL